MTPACRYCSVERPSRRRVCKQRALRSLRNQTDFTPRPCRTLVPTADTTPTLRAERGLSRLEFVACVTVVAVLMAVFLTSLQPWRAHTREVQLLAALASVHAADTRFQAACAGAAAPDCHQLAIDGQTVAGAFGHPSAAADGITRLAGLTGPEWIVLPTRRDGVPALVIRVASAAAGGCEFLYVQAPRQGTAPVIQPVDSSCH